MANSFEALIVTGFAALATAYTTPARADHSLVGLAAAVVGHATLAPGYASIGHYGRHPEKRMATPWVVTNGATSLMAGSLGVVVMYYGISTLGKTADGNGEQVFATVCGASLVAGAIVVGGYTISQSSREPSQKMGSAPVIVLPSVGRSRECGTTMQLVAVGRF